MSNRKNNIYTDLAIEARELISENRRTEDDELPGIQMESYENGDGSITVTWVTVLNEAGEREMGKPIGNYVTIEAPAIRENSANILEEAAKILSEQLEKLLKLPNDATVLVAGLGNWNVTPDALGPRVVSKTLVTRHILEEVPDEIDERVRPVSALSPGVMGITGIETAEILKGVVDRVKPHMLIAIDALAARRTSRINTTIQISDTGIAPGGGMGNKRKALNKETLGIPVIAIGVPTVVDAATLINDTMDKMLNEISAAAGEDSGFFEMLKGLDSAEKYNLIVEILDPYAENMFVTPKEVDAVIERLAAIISKGLNSALHPQIDFSDIGKLPL